MSITIKNTIHKHDIPIGRLMFFPNSIFAIGFQFKKQTEYALANSHELAVIHHILMGNDMTIKDYMANRHLLSRYGLLNESYELIIEDSNNGMNAISSFMNNPKGRIWVINNLKQYVSYKQIFATKGQIIPFQLIKFSIHEYKLNILLGYKGYPILMGKTIKRSSDASEQDMIFKYMHYQKTIEEATYMLIMDIINVICGPLANIGGLVTKNLENLIKDLDRNNKRNIEYERRGAEDETNIILKGIQKYFAYVPNNIANKRNHDMIDHVKKDFEGVSNSHEVSNNCYHQYACMKRIFHSMGDDREPTNEFCIMEQLMIIILDAYAIEIAYSTLTDLREYPNLYVHGQNVDTIDVERKNMVNLNDSLLEHINGEINSNYISPYFSQVVKTTQEKCCGKITANIGFIRL